MAIENTSDSENWEPQIPAGNLAICTEQLEAIQYFVGAAPLASADFMVPQGRKRIYLWCVDISISSKVTGVDLLDVGNTIQCLKLPCEAP